MNYFMVIFYAFILLIDGGIAMADNSHPVVKVDDLVWESVSAKRIYFGHQSVGDNIIKGINSLSTSPVSKKFTIVKTNDPATINQPMFAHSSIGKNDFPETKVAAFREYMDKGIAAKVDIAFFKFCFWDIRAKTDVQQLFTLYKTTLTDLKRKYPNVQFVHMSVPLMSQPKDMVSGVKRMLGVIVGADLDNIRRNEFNKLIYSEYAGKEPLFDIAAIESTRPDGTRSTFQVSGKQYFSMDAQYTNDSGHLNEAGQKIVAANFLTFLSTLEGSRKGK